MNNILRNINWIETSKEFPALLCLDLPVNIDPLDSGLEADVFKIGMQESQFVLKVWNRDSKPNISIQYKFLDYMYNLGAAVSRPYGWGTDENNNPVLLSSYDGVPIKKVSKSILDEFAKMLVEIHKLEFEITDSLTIPKYDFTDYFFPSINEHLDIKELLIELVDISKMQQIHLIHGDYNLGNILELDGKLTIIDWTNIQYGDTRYDIAWSIILVWIYVSERYCSIYRNVFVTNYNYKLEEMELFEAIACLRWVLLNRIANLPKRNNTISTVRMILSKNKYLNGKLLL